MTNYCPTKRWYVFYTYPKFERKVHLYLQKENFESFLPLHWVVRQWSDRRKRLQVPLLPNYIFVNVECNRIFDILKIPKIIRCVTFNGEPSFLKQTEVDWLKMIVENNYPFEISTNLEIGDPVVITKGTLTGMEGILSEERGSCRFVVEIEALQQFVLVNIPAEYLELKEVLV